MVTPARHRAAAPGPAGTPIEQLTTLHAAIGHASLGDPVIAPHHRGSPSSPARSAGPGGLLMRPARLPHPAEHPTPIRGVQDATSDLPQISAWWGRYPAANPSLATGHRFGALSLDHPTGRAALARLARDLGPVIQTGAGRLVVLVRPSGLPSGRLSAGGPGTPTVFRHAAGSLIPAPPSRHPSGQPARWLTPETLPLPDAAQLLDKLAQAARALVPGTGRRWGWPGRGRWL